jgi:hypothetical protein
LWNSAIASRPLDPQFEASYVAKSDKLDAKELKLDRETARLTDKYKLPSQRSELSSAETKLAVKHARLIAERQRLAESYALKSEIKITRCKGLECSDPSCPAKFRSGCTVANPGPPSCGPGLTLSGGRCVAEMSALRCADGQIWTSNRCQVMTTELQATSNCTLLRRRALLQLDEAERLHMAAELACGNNPSGPVCADLTQRYQTALALYRILMSRSLSCY